MHDYHDGRFGEETPSSEYCSNLQYAPSSLFTPFLKHAQQRRLGYRSQRPGFSRTPESV